MRRLSEGWESLLLVLTTWSQLHGQLLLHPNLCGDASPSILSTFSSYTPGWGLVAASFPLLCPNPSSPQQMNILFNSWASGVTQTSVWIAAWGSCLCLSVPQFSHLQVVPTFVGIVKTEGQCTYPCLGWGLVMDMESFLREVLPRQDLDSWVGINEGFCWGWDGGPSGRRWCCT